MVCVQFDCHVLIHDLSVYTQVKRRSSWVSGERIYDVSNLSDNCILALIPKFAWERNFGFHCRILDLLGKEIYNKVLGCFVWCIGVSKRNPYDKQMCDWEMHVCVLEKSSLPIDEWIRMILSCIGSFECKLSSLSPNSINPLLEKIFASTFSCY